MDKILTSIYFLDGAVSTYAFTHSETAGSTNRWVMAGTKIALMPLLAWVYARSCPELVTEMRYFTIRLIFRRKSNKGTNLEVLAALFFSWLGDVFLLLPYFYPNQGEPLFLAGLVAFLVAHLFYIRVMTDVGEGVVEFLARKCTSTDP